MGFAGDISHMAAILLDFSYIPTTLPRFISLLSLAVCRNKYNHVMNFRLIHAFSHGLDPIWLKMIYCNRSLSLRLRLVVSFMSSHIWALLMYTICPSFDDRGLLECWVGFNTNFVSNCTRLYFQINIKIYVLSIAVSKLL